MRLPLPQWLVAWIIRRARRTPFWHLDGYMERYWLLGGSDRDDRPEEERGWRGSRLDRFIGRFVAIRVHHILRSDNDRHMHDHPWNFTTIILRGGYVEITPKLQEQDAEHDPNWLMRSSMACPPGTVIRRRATDRHLLELASGRTAWTLFIMGPKRQEWGFYTPHGKVLAEHYEAYKAGAPDVRSLLVAGGVA